MADSFWDDFSNNLATDLAPFIALLGESPTKQYLSECLTIEDILIFALAPIGVITAVVSAIRVCGTPSMRAFVGRAQEGAGNAEAELCSSTSRDVCELYTNGGVARVFGRPKLLEIVHDPDASPEEFYPSAQGEVTAGIYSFREYVGTNKGKEEWKNQPKMPSSSVEEGQKDDRGQFAPNPNLSLNIGIKPRSRSWFIAAVMTGVMMQLFVLVWAVITRYHYQWTRGNTQEAFADEYAVPVVILGTCLLCLGMALCAWLIESKTDERIFHRDLSKPTSTTYWVQPGNQRVGDQMFDSFAYDDARLPLQKYLTSWKDIENEASIKRIWTAILTTVAGFIFQFLGLRACHSSVAVMQLGATIIMSLIRSGLRTQRLKREDNFMTGDPDFFQGHELDFLTMRMSRPEQSGNAKDGSFTLTPKGQCTWKIFCPLERSNDEIIDRSGSTMQSSHSASDTQGSAFIKPPGKYLGDHPLIFGFQSTCSAEDEISKWISRKYCSQCKDECACSTTDSKTTPNSAVKSLYFRSRLSRMTGMNDPKSEHSSYWGEEFVMVRNTALKLTKAIEKTMNILFQTDPPRYIDPTIVPYENWYRAYAIFWTIRCSLLCPTASVADGNPSANVLEGSNVHLSLRRVMGQGEIPDSPWKADSSEIEGVLSLWLWSLKEWHEKQDGEERNVTRIDERICRILRNTPDEGKNVDYDIWRKQAVAKAEKYSLRLENGSTFNCATAQNAVWFKDTGEEKYITKESGPPRSACQQRFFGWYNVETSSPCSELTILAVPSKNTLLLNCAQEVFCTFLIAILQAIKHIGGSTTNEKREGDFKVENQNIEDIQGILIREGLCDEDDAFACTVPIMVNQSKIRPPREALFQAYRLADQYRQNRKWEDCKTLVSWYLRISEHGEVAFSSNGSRWGQSLGFFEGEPYKLQSFTEEANMNRLRLSIIEACELYRRSHLESDGKQNEFRRGILGLVKRCTSAQKHTGIPFIWSEYGIPPKTTNTLVNTVKCYAQAALWSMNGEEQKSGGQRLLEELEKYASVPGMTFKPEKPAQGSLLRAIRVFNLSHTLYLLQKYQITEPEMSEALILASRKGWFMVVKYLAELGAKINFKDEKGRTSLSYALESGDINTVITLVENKADIGLQSMPGHNETVSRYVMRQGYAAIATYMVEGNKVSMGHSAELLNLAITSGNAAIVRFHLSNGHVSIGGKEHLIDLLVEHDRIDPNLAGGYLVDSPPIVWAVRLKNEAIFKKLLNSERVDWASALGLDVYIKELRTSGRVHRIHDEDHGHDSPLSIAVRVGHLNVVRELWKEWERSSVPNLKAILIAAKNGKTDIVKELLPYTVKDKEFARRIFKEYQLERLWPEIEESDTWETARQEAKEKFEPFKQKPKETSHRFDADMGDLDSFELRAITPRHRPGANRRSVPLVRRPLGTRHGLVERSSTSEFDHDGQGEEATSVVEGTRENHQTGRNSRTIHQPNIWRIEEADEGL
ncbi:putative ankyrin repeat protein [Hypoxylon sp. FL1284]|nr:putative ankyrin repeat protein [Hypoxylon sp. FL1284]